MCQGSGTCKTCSGPGRVKQCMIVGNIVLLLPAVTLPFARPLEKLEFLVFPVVPFLHGLPQNSLREKVFLCSVAGTSISQCVTVLLVKMHSTEIKSVPLASNPANKHPHGLSSAQTCNPRFLEQRNKNTSLLIWFVEIMGQIVPP